LIGRNDSRLQRKWTSGWQALMALFMQWIGWTLYYGVPGTLVNMYFKVVQLPRVIK
jgi:hypothetical protein